MTSKAHLQAATLLRPAPKATVLDGLIHQRMVGPVIFMGERCFVGGSAVPAYTTSLDAAAGLARDMLPGWTIGLELGEEGSMVSLSPPEGMSSLALMHTVIDEPASFALCVILFAVIEAVMCRSDPDVETGTSALRGLLETQKDNFGRRNIATIDRGELELNMSKRAAIPAPIEDRETTLHP